MLTSCNSKLNTARKTGDTLRVIRPEFLYASISGKKAASLALEASSRKQWDRLYLRLFDGNSTKETRKRNIGVVNVAMDFVVKHPQQKESFPHFCFDRHMEIKFPKNCLVASCVARNPKKDSLYNFVVTLDEISAPFLFGKDNCDFFPPAKTSPI